MYEYILRRLGFGLMTMLGVSIIVFLLMRVLPGDPLVAIFGMEGFTKLTAEDRAHYMAELGLSDPLVVQYLKWMGDVVTGELGRSFFRDESVADMIVRRGPLSVEIGLLSVVISWIVGLPVGIISALRPNTVADTGARIMSILFLAVPGFWLGILIVLALLFQFGYKAPLTGVPFWEDPWANLQDRHRAGIGFGGWAGCLHCPHGALVAIGSHSRRLRPHRPRQGVIERLVVNRHALPNALLPVITLSGVLMGLVLGGSIPIEQAFGVPGLGRAMITAVIERDIMVMQNLVFLYSFVFVLVNVLVDVTYAWFDPRIHYQ